MVKIKIDRLIHLLNLKYDLEGKPIKRAKKEKWKKELMQFRKFNYKTEEIDRLLGG